MKLFLDTEFSGLSRPMLERKLISLALVGEDGHTEWYAEVGGWVLDDCDPWVQRNVLSLLTGPFMSRDEARVSLRAWFSTLQCKAKVACDSETDWHLLLDLLGECPANLDLFRYDLAALISTSIYQHTVSMYFEQGHPEHHAFHDARSYRLGWLAWMDANKADR